MPHFTVKRRKGILVEGVYTDYIRKIFFFQLDPQNGFPIDDYFVILFETNFQLSRTQFENLIDNLTGCSNATCKTQKFNYFLSKQKNLIDINFLTNTLNLPVHIRNYSINSIAVSANYFERSSNGNLFIIYTEDKNEEENLTTRKTSSKWFPRNEISINLSIRYSHIDIDYLQPFKNCLNYAVKSFTSKSSVEIFKLQTCFKLNNNNNKKSKYEVTQGHNEARQYKNAYKKYLKSDIYTSILFNELPFNSG